MSESEAKAPFTFRIMESGSWCAIRVRTQSYRCSNEDARGIAAGAYGVVVRGSDGVVGYWGFGYVRDPNVLFAYGLSTVMRDPSLDGRTRRLGLLTLCKRTGFQRALQAVAKQWPEYGGVNTRNEDLEGKDAWRALVEELNQGKLQFFAKGGHRLPELTRRADELAKRYVSTAEEEGNYRPLGIVKAGTIRYDK